MQLESCVLVLCLSLSALAQPQSSPSPSTKSGMPMTMMVAPLFLEDSRFSSTLNLLNASSEATYATVLVRSTNGETILQKKVALLSNATVHVPLRQLLDEAKSSDARGSIVVEQSPDLKGMAVLAQLSITYQGAHASYVDEELAMPDPAMDSSMLRAVGTGKEVTSLVAISSLSQSSQEIGINCLSSNAETISNTVTVGPNATLLINACKPDASTSATFSATQSLDPVKLDDDTEVEQSTTQAVGIQLVSNAGPGQFAAFGISRHRANNDLILGAVPFSDPKLAASSSTVFAGVPTGPADLLAGGPYRPYVALANFSLHPVHATVQFSTTSGASNATSTRKAGDIVLPARRATTISLADLQGDPGLRNSFIVSSDAAPGDLAVRMASNAADGGGDVELLGKDSGQSENMGAHPWSVVDGNESTLLLFNHTEQKQEPIVIVLSGKSVWRKRMKLEPLQTIALNIGDLVKSKMPHEPEFFTRDIDEGQVQWTMAREKTITGRMLVSNKVAGMARNFSCQSYSVLCGVGITPGSATIPVGGGANFLLSTSSCMAYNVGDCYGSCCGGGVSVFYYWSLGGGLSGSCGDSFSCGVTGASPGSTTVIGTAKSSYCTLPATASVTVTTTPTISSIAPAKGLIGTTISGVTIAGAAFGTAPTVNAGTGITVTYGSRNNTSITANLAIAANATAGNHAVTVTANGQTSSAANFYVQVPSRMSMYTYGPLNVITNGNVVDYFGTILLYHQCGVYRNITYNLLDQSGGTIFGGDFTFNESFSNYSTTVSPNPGQPPAESSIQNTSVQVLADIQYIGFAAPSCLTSNEHESFDQSFSVTLGSTSFPLSTVNHIERGKYSGVNKVDVTVKTP